MTFRHYKAGRSSAKSTGRLYPWRNPWYSLSEAESTSGHMVLSGVPRKISQVTPPGIDPGTVQLVAQRLTTTLPQTPSYSPLICWSQWPRGLRLRSSAARLLRLWVRIPPGAWMIVCCECCVLSGRGLCDGLITRPEESYRLWRVVVCNQDTSEKKTRKIKPATGLCKYNHSGL